MARAWPEGQAAPEENRQGFGRDDLARVGMALGGLALAWYGLRRGGLLGAGFVAVGGVLASAGTARQLADGELGAGQAARRVALAQGWSQPITIARSITIGRPRAEVYRFWRDLSNLPRFMRHVERIDVHPQGRSHWVVRAPLGGTVEWDAQIDDDRENETISWHALEGADVPNSGRVTFRDAPGGRGTELHVTITYEAPAGRIGQQIARLLGEEPGTQAQEDLRRLKQLLETGEIATAGPR